MFDLPSPVQITGKDEEVLEYLADVTVEDLEPEEDEDGDEMAGFKLTFTFAPNPFFENETLVRGCPRFQGGWGQGVRSPLTRTSRVLGVCGPG